MVMLITTAKANFSEGQRNIVASYRVWYSFLPNFQTHVKTRSCDPNHSGSGNLRQGQITALSANPITRRNIRLLKGVDVCRAPAWWEKNKSMPPRHTKGTSSTLTNRGFISRTGPVHCFCWQETFRPRRGTLPE